MKRKIILVFLYFIVTFNTSAQNKWQIGANISPLFSKYLYSGAVINDNPLTETNSRLGFSTGIDAYRVFGTHIKFKTGLNFLLRNYKAYIKLSGSGDYKNINSHIYSVGLPLGLQYYFKIKKQQFFISTVYELSYMFKSVDKIDSRKYSRTYSTWNLDTELFFGAGYLFNFSDKYRFFIQPEYSPQIFNEDYQTFCINLGIIF